MNVIEKNLDNIFNELLELKQNIPSLRYWLDSVETKVCNIIQSAENEKLWARVRMENPEWWKET